MRVDESKEILFQIIDLYHRYSLWEKSGEPLTLKVIPQFFKACEVAMEALDDIEEISQALSEITESECSSYGYENACDKADKWCQKFSIEKKGE